MKKFLTEKFPADLFAKLLLPLAFVVSGFQHSIFADQNNTAFIVAGGDFNSPFYNLTFESVRLLTFKIIHFEREINTFLKQAIFPRPTHLASDHLTINLSKCNRRDLTKISQNNQSITVTIPADFQGTLAYYCTVHSAMLKEFIIAEPGGDTGGPGTRTRCVKILQRIRPKSDRPEGTENRKGHFPTTKPMVSQVTGRKIPGTPLPPNPSSKHHESGRLFSTDNNIHPINQNAGTVARTSGITSIDLSQNQVDSLVGQMLPMPAHMPLKFRLTVQV